MRISDQLRGEIERSEMSTYAIAQQAGVRPESLYRFLDGRRTLQLATVDAIAEVLGLELRTRKRRK